jgi:exodeoxyribonuclease V alpha subunit
MDNKKDDKKESGAVVRELITSVKKIIYSKAGYYIFTFVIIDHKDKDKIGSEFTAKGSIPFTIVPRMKLKLIGSPIFDSDRNKWNLVIKNAHEIVDDSNRAVKVLTEADGIGPAKAKKIIDQLGESALTKIRSSPSCLTKIEGITDIDVLSIHKRVKDFFNEDDGLQKLYGFELTNFQISKIREYFGTYDTKTIKERCFELVNVCGFGFLTVSRIADAIGVAKANLLRIESGILYASNELMSSGSVCFDGKQLVDNASKLLCIGKETVSDSFKGMIRKNQIVTLDSDVSFMSKILPNNTNDDDYEDRNDSDE